METLTVSQLNEFIKSTITAENFLQRVTVFGEVSSFKYSGVHAYFVLKDKDGAIPCSCFYAKKTYNPTKEGESVICTGKVDYYSKSGKLSLIVEAIQPVGKGELHIKLEKLKAKLLQEGLFAESHKKAIPTYCKSVGVVTSRTGAVIRDIVRTVRNKNKSLDISVFDVRVQGENAAEDIGRGLKIMDELGFDCIILARGGGSFEDLMPFNDEGLARIIYAMKTPIISAVGHETDFSISDFVADARSATPTAAAELVAFDEEQVKEQIKALIAGMYSDLLKIERAKETQTKASIRALEDKALRKFERAESNTMMLMQDLTNKTEKLIADKERRVMNCLSLLDSKNPLKLLKNGYFRIWKDQKVISFDDVKTGDELEIIAYEGVITATVNGKRNNE